ncbi:cytochrome c [Bordetella pertussis]|uniref:Cytochrome c n=32 Tax=Alcaligenaceae TaxID=506 RepID=Q7VX17_BORPE|nr:MULTISPECIES: c-type cytochrome [Bordetella]ETH41024.1 cytochrome c2 [Bordetella pertussis H918]ETH44868.1 cytochrome c2 [Bordetella pertussis H939]ETH45517.1 cytochrome c2 [Bordetella pertussis H921]ETH69375.1 cytochrome c2 [Bordetella pertussis STO1-CHLA-0011]ETH84518.1 cytochrome c2 [Bordetella pertussis STO1-CHOC-0017]ETH85350.1 cytochrome c2 [Bordetella pertussis STO1-CHOC-0018]ETH92076.1 cytochrome c2 [Bordetella pertussis STO1-CHOC-0019]ETH99014.1 cytochrome c2 [Bordetella pertuss
MNAGLAWRAGALCLALAAPSAARAAAPDPVRGEQVYARCLACHALAYDRVGPRHCGLLGRKAGSVPGFAYTQAMKDSGLTWDAATLDRFLADPLKTVPGTAMTYAGVPDAGERADLIAYLRAAAASPACAGVATPH